MPLLACFVFVVRPKLLIFRRIDFRKQYFHIENGVKIGVGPLGDREASVLWRGVEGVEDRSIRDFK